MTKSRVPTLAKGNPLLKVGIGVGVGVASAVGAAMVIVSAAAIVTHGDGEQLWVLPPLMFAPLSQLIASAVAVWWVLSTSSARVPVGVVALASAGGALLLFVLITLAEFNHVSWGGLVLATSGSIVGFRASPGSPYAWPETVHWYVRRLHARIPGLRRCRAPGQPLDLNL